MDLLSLIPLFININNNNVHLCGRHRSTPKSFIQQASRESMKMHKKKSCMKKLMGTSKAAAAKQANKTSRKPDCQFHLTALTTE